ncbi:Protein of unknown function [Pyronema omphalodes CBS 100304]|uniref:Uncharacterized protein n=1 Tax=Pyronema omphalodes (strain CBS 100304) TaxID=1076935 RepID=U4KV79_PYROM|nr:Protein of unknown function [Pyronema omphalodes CBS 100304]
MFPTHAETRHFVNGSRILMPFAHQNTASRNHSKHGSQSYKCNTEEAS